MDNLSSADAKSILERSSFVGLEVLYVCSLSYRTRKPFSIKNLYDKVKVKFFDPSYVHGYLVACTMFDLLEYTENDDMMIVVELNNEVALAIKEFIYAKAEEWDKTEVNNSEPTLWKKELSKIEHYFGIKS